MKSNQYLASIYLLIIYFISAGLLLSNSSNEETKFENFSLYDYNNELHSLNNLTNKNGIVIMFISTQCPVSNAYNKRMAKLFGEFNSDFEFIGINSNKQETISEIKEHAVQNNFDFIILKDSNNVVADRFEASVTPEVFILDNDFAQKYHGRIDDSRREDDVEEENLRNALIQIKNGKGVTVKKTKAFGCTIKRVK